MLAGVSNEITTRMQRVAQGPDIQLYELLDCCRASKLPTLVSKANCKLHNAADSGLKILGAPIQFGRSKQEGLASRRRRQD